MLSFYFTQSRTSGKLYSMAYTQEERDAAIAKVVAGLSVGTPLTIICSADGMPSDDSIRIWSDADPLIARAIARAREAGHDAIAQEAMDIVDAAPERVITTTGEDRSETRIDSASVQWAKNRAELRLKLLAKWDPKRYGDRLTHAGDPDQPVQIAHIRRTVVDPRELG